MHVRVCVYVSRRNPALENPSSESPGFAAVNQFLMGEFRGDSQTSLRLSQLLNSGQPLCGSIHKQVIGCDMLYSWDVPPLVD